MEGQHIKGIVWMFFSLIIKGGSGYFVNVLLFYCSMFFFYFVMYFLYFLKSVVGWAFVGGLYVNIVKQKEKMCC